MDRRARLPSDLRVRLTYARRSAGDRDQLGTARFAPSSGACCYRVRSTQPCGVSHVELIGLAQQPQSSAAVRSTRCGSGWASRDGADTADRLRAVPFCNTAPVVPTQWRLCSIRASTTASLYPVPPLVQFRPRPSPQAERVTARLYASNTIPSATCTCDRCRNGTIQIGPSGNVIGRDDATATCIQIHDFVKAGDSAAAKGRRSGEQR
jgi:hypothetical protein